MDTGHFLKIVGLHYTHKISFVGKAYKLKANIVLDVYNRHIYVC